MKSSFIPLDVLIDRLDVIEAALKQGFTFDLVSDRHETLMMIINEADRLAGSRHKPRETGSLRATHLFH